MKKYSLLAVFLLLMCNVSVCGQTGRILFVDTTFIEKTNLQRIHHSPIYYSGNPVLKADKKWELNINGDPYAAPFSGGVWYDEEEHKFKMWYSAGGGKLLGLVTCYAESSDGKVWIKPELDVVPGTNIVDTLEHDCVSVLQKRNEVLIGWSKDGFHWNRENKKPFLPVSEDFHAWNAGNVQSTAGSPLIVGDSLYFYVSGRYNSKPKHDSNFATGLAMLRRDGFVSMRAGRKEGYIEIKTQIPANGNYLFVNADVKGTLAVEVLDDNGQPMEGFTKKDCISMKKSDKTKQMISWEKHLGVTSLVGKTVRLKFYLNQADIYAFWISAWQTGESGGYTGGGGPGLSDEGIDTPMDKLKNN